MMWGFSGNLGGWAFAIHLLFSWLVPLAVIFLLIYLAVVWGKERKYSQGYADLEDPLNILKQRYAKGEITSEDYHRMKEELKSD